MWHNNVSIWTKSDRYSIWYDAHYNEWSVGFDLDRIDNISPGMYVPISSPYEECPDNVQNEWRLFDGTGYLQLPAGYVFIECVKGKVLRFVSEIQFFVINHYCADYGEVQFSRIEHYVTQGSTKMAISATKLNVPDEEADVKWKLIGNGAVVADNGTFHFNSEETQKVFMIDIANDTDLPYKMELYEPGDGFYLGEATVTYLSSVGKLSKYCKSENQIL